MFAVESLFSMSLCCTYQLDSSSVEWSFQETARSAFSSSRDRLPVETTSGEIPSVVLLVCFPPSAA